MKLHMRFYQLAVLVLFFQQATAQGMPQVDEPTALFATHCIANYISPGFNVENELNSRKGVLKLTEQQAAPFLDNAKGNAWTFKTAKNQYVVAVTGTASCYLYAISGDRDRAWSDFDAVTSSLFKPWSALELLPTVVGKNTDSHRNSKSVYYNAPDSAPTPAFFITTDYSGAANSFAIRLKVQFAEKALLDLLKEGAAKSGGSK